jgi:hypothetical protein
MPLTTHALKQQTFQYNHTNRKCVCERGRKRKREREREKERELPF